MFQQIFRILSPDVVLFDDIDRVEERNLDKLLGIIEILNRYTGSGEIIIMGSINSLNKLPEAMRRPGRFDEIILFDYPTTKQRESIIRGYLKHFGTRLSNDNLTKLVDLTDMMTPAYLKEVALQATIQPFDKIPSVIDHMKKMMVCTNGKGAAPEEEKESC